MHHWRKVLKRMRSARVALCNQSSEMAHRTRWVIIENFDQERVFHFEPLRQWSPSKIFYPFWAPQGGKLRVGLFDRLATKTWIQSFWGATMSQILKILTLKDFGPLRQWFPSRIFYPFWAPHGWRSRIGLFDRRATKTWIRSFWGATMSQILKILTWRDFGPSRQWSGKLPSTIYHQF